MSRRRGDPDRAHSRACRMGRSQRAIDAVGNRVGSRADGMSKGSVGRFIDSAANAMDGNGEKLRQTMTQLSGVGGYWPTEAATSSTSSATCRLSSLRCAAVVNRSCSSRTDSRHSAASWTTADPICAALTNLSDVVGETTRFIAGTRDQTAEQIQRLTNVTQNLADHRMDLENVLHVAPTAIANLYNMYDPDTGGASGAFALNNFANPDLDHLRHDRGGRQRHRCRVRPSCVRSTWVRRCGC